VLIRAVRSAFREPIHNSSRQPVRERTAAHAFECKPSQRYHFAGPQGGVEMFGDIALCGLSGILQSHLTSTGWSQENSYTCPALLSGTPSQYGSLGHVRLYFASLPMY
jgi:hypothetical protein